MENVERNRDKSLGVSVYLGQRRGNASTSDFSQALLRDTVRAAYDIARFTAEDEFAGLPDAEDLALDAAARPALDLFHPWAIDAPSRRRDCFALRGRRVCDRQAHHQQRGRVRLPQQSHFLHGQPRGFRGAMPVRGIRCRWRQLPGPRRGMERDAWYSSMRDAAELASPEAVGRYAAERALSRLKARKVKTAEVPGAVREHAGRGPAGRWCRPPVAARSTAAPPSCSTAWASRCWPRTSDVHEDPHVRKGKGSSPFDDEGVVTRARSVVDSGVLQGYSCPATRRASWACAPPGHAGGSHNLSCCSRLTAPGDDLPTMLRRWARACS